MLDQDNNFYLISWNILISCLLDNVRILLGEVSCWSLLGVQGLTTNKNSPWFSTSFYSVKSMLQWMLITHIAWSTQIVVQTVSTFPAHSFNGLLLAFSTRNIIVYNTCWNNKCKSSITLFCYITLTKDWKNNPGLKTPVVETMWLLSYGPNMKGDLQGNSVSDVQFFSCGSPITFYR